MQLRARPPLLEGLTKTCLFASDIRPRPQDCSVLLGKISHSDNRLKGNGGIKRGLLQASPCQPLPQQRVGRQAQLPVPCAPSRSHPGQTLDGAEQKLLALVPRDASCLVGNGENIRW